MKHLQALHRHYLQRGQTLIMFVFFIVVLFLFTGLCLDLGFAYITQAQLSKAVDSSSLVGARNITSGQATNIVKSVFAMNYGRPGRDAGLVTPVISIVTDPISKTRRMQVKATATINTFFIRILPMWKTMQVSANAEAVRSRAVLSVILDKSGSMKNNGGCADLPWATDTFINLFDDNQDKAALVTFNVYAQTLVTLRQPFKQAISNAIPRNCSQYQSYTYMQDGLQHGYDEILKETIAPGESVIRAAVFFTDGLPNTITESWACGGTTATRNVSGGDAPQTGINTYPTNSTTALSCSTAPPAYPDAAAIRIEAQNRTKTLAQQMRQAGILVYTIGLAADDTLGKPLLRNLANVATPPSTTLPYPGEPSGIAVFPATSADIASAFQIIASDILGRLTR